MQRLIEFYKKIAVVNIANTVKIANTVFNISNPEETAKKVRSCRITRTTISKNGNVTVKECCRNVG